jgi:CRISPR-associated protein Csd1
MILQALYEYYQRKAEDPQNQLAPWGWEWKEIPFVIVLNEQGEFMDLQDMREGAGRKKTAKSLLVPQGQESLRYCIQYALGWTRLCVRRG